MVDENVKFRIGSNIAAYRKRDGLTQVSLAEKLNYSDKAVSKWERGESIPDVLTLMQLAELFGITVNDLVCDPNALPDTRRRSSLRPCRTLSAQDPLRSGSRGA